MTTAVYGQSRFPANFVYTVTVDEQRLIISTLVLMTGKHQTYKAVPTIENKVSSKGVQLTGRQTNRATTFGQLGHKLLK